jgi:hypothetical protein
MNTFGQKKPEPKKPKKKSRRPIPPPVKPLFGSEGYHRTDRTESALLESLVQRNDFIFVRLKQADWGFTDFTIMLTSSSTLLSVCRHIEERHGQIALDVTNMGSSLRLFRHPPNEKNIIPPSLWPLQLSQLGMVGGSIEEHQQAILYYSFIPAASSVSDPFPTLHPSSNPVLMRDPQLIVPKLTQEENEAYLEQKMNQQEEISSILPTNPLNININSMNPSSNFTFKSNNLDKDPNE